MGEHFIAKYSAHNDELEGDNLLFLEHQQLGAFTPRLYGMWRDGGKLFLVMERLHGETLETLWPALLEVDKQKILSKLREAFDIFRVVPHEGYFGSVTRSHMPHHLFYWPQYPAHISGPFNDEASLLQGPIQKARLTAAAQPIKRHSYQADFFSSHLSLDLVTADRKPVFTHSDLQRKNIFVEEVQVGDGEKEFRVKVVDWKSAGWYSVYWEYVAAVFAFHWDDDWCVRIVDPWPAEAAMTQLIYQDLWM
ncbi:hypothetical protein IFR05_002968 [Cadophora sp. M221]|nr:hypothetical protein IFR05_002968 [Cadophora sp. M221]